MAGPFQFLDLSALTTSLVDALDAAITNDPMWTVAMPKPAVSVSGSAPESVRDSDGGCKVTLYLFHVEADPHNRNAPLLGKRAAELPFQPMALNLYYLLTAYAKENYVHEQQMMSIALRWFYEHPTFSTVAGANHFTMTMQPESADELGRLWQSMVITARLATVYRVAVVFMTAPEPVTPLAKPVESLEILADPAVLPLAENGAVIGTERRVSYRVPNDPELRVFRQSPASAAPGRRFLLWGSNLGSAPSDHIYLLSADGTETDVSSWIVAGADPPGGSRRTLALPATTGAPPANAPPPGVYQLRIGSDAPLAYRSNSTPFLVAPGITGPATPNVFLTPAGGVFGLTGINFIAAATDVLLGTVSLTRISPGDPLDPGTFLADTPTSIQFRLPATIPTGDYPVRVRVNQVEADPSWWVHG